MTAFDVPNPWSHMESASKGEYILSMGCSQKWIHSLYLGYDRHGRYVFLFKLPEGNKDIDNLTMVIKDNTIIDLSIDK